MVKQSGVRPPEYWEPKLASELQHIFEWWVQLNSERPSGGMSIGALSTKLMYDYLYIIGIKPLSIEIKVLQTIERKFLEHIHGRYSKLTNKSR